MADHPYRNHIDEATDKVKQTGETSARAVGEAMKTAVKKLLQWFKQRLWDKPKQYLKVKTGKWLRKVQSKTFEWVEAEEVPDDAKEQYEFNEGKILDKYDVETDNVFDIMDNPFKRKAQKAVLDEAHDLEAAKKASKSQELEALAQNNPDLLDADTKMGVELKVAAYEGDLDSTVNQFDISAEEAGEIIGSELAARAGYNTFGDSLPGEINQVKTDADADTSQSDNGDATGETSTGNNTTGSTADSADTGSTTTSSGDSTVDLDVDVPMSGTEAADAYTGSTGTGSSPGSAGNTGGAGNGGASN